MCCTSKSTEPISINEQMENESLQRIVCGRINKAKIFGEGRGKGLSLYIYSLSQQLVIGERWRVKVSTPQSRLLANPMDTHVTLVAQDTTLLWNWLQQVMDALMVLQVLANQ